MKRDLHLPFMPQFVHKRAYILPDLSPTYLFFAEVCRCVCLYVSKGSVVSVASSGDNCIRLDTGLEPEGCDLEARGPESCKRYRRRSLVFISGLLFAPENVVGVDHDNKTYHSESMYLMPVRAPRAQACMLVFTWSALVTLQTM